MTNTLAAFCAAIAVCAYCDTAAHAAPNDTQLTPIPGLEIKHMSADYWISKDENLNVRLKSESEVAALRTQSFRNDPNLVDLSTFPKILKGKAVVDAVTSISRAASYPLYFENGATVTNTDYDRLQYSLNLGAVGAEVAIQFGLVVSRANLRTWPTNQAAYDTRSSVELDMFQESALFPADVVAILHTSEDTKWLFVQSYNYAAWVHSSNIAFGDRRKILDYKDESRFIIVTGDKVRTNHNPYDAHLSELQLDMGVRLPIANISEAGALIGGQNPLASIPVVVPVRSETGRLSFDTALIARSEDVNIGYLPYSRGNVIRQAYKFLGERYGWGHSNNARDCTGLVNEVFKTFGIDLPRNSSQQGQSPIGENRLFQLDASKSTKLGILSTAEPGDLLYATGHVMIYLGDDHGEPFVIHDLYGAGWVAENGRFQPGALNGVSVTPLTTIHSSKEQTYFEKMYGVKKLP